MSWTTAKYVSAFTALIVEGSGEVGEWPSQAHSRRLGKKGNTTIQFEEYVIQEDDYQCSDNHEY